MNQQTTNAILIELDDKSWDSFLDSAAKWFDNLLLVQSSYKKLLADTAEKVTELHIKAYLTEMHDREKLHEGKIEELYKIVNRDSSVVRKTLGTVLGKAREVLGDVIAFTGGVKGPWQDLHQLFLSNTNTMSAFAVVEQIGLSIGVPEIVDIAIPIEMDLAADHLILQELTLEMAGVAIMYNQSF
jgi:hypothetical protein